MAPLNPRTCIPALLAVIALSGPAVAAATAPSQNDVATLRVAYGDLDIHSEAGARLLYSRLKHAARQACNVRPMRELGGIRLSREAKACYNEILTKAVEQIDSDKLQKIHAG